MTVLAISAVTGFTVAAIFYALYLHDVRHAH